MVAPQIRFSCCSTVSFHLVLVLLESRSRPARTPGTAPAVVHLWSGALMGWGPGLVEWVLGLRCCSY